MQVKTPHSPEDLLNQMQEEGEFNALANSSFQASSSANPPSEAQSNDNININNDIPMLDPVDNDHSNNKELQNENGITTDNENEMSKFNITNNHSLSVIGMEPINSPRKAMQNLLIQPIDNKPRLVIDKLVLTNFKSYAGRKEIGPFHTSFSAVVGPNGSGKSNVIDSLLFVFGFRAAKMRQSKLSELIHNSEAYPNLQFCRVDIHFKKIIDNYDSMGNNTNNPTIIENSNLVVSRKASANNNSTYFINDTTSSYTEVTTLLRQEGIDLDHKRFLILQGEVEQIAQMKPKAEGDNDDGLLEYLEDIIGTAKYKEEIEKNVSELESQTELFRAKERRFDYTSKEFKELTKQKDSALQYLTLEKILKDETAKYWFLTSHSAKLSVEKNKTRLVEMNEKIKDDNELIKEAQKKISTLNKKKQSINNSVAEIDNQLAKSKSEFKTVEKEVVSLNENLKITQKKTDNTSKTLEANKKTLSSNQSEMESLDDNISSHTKELTKLNKELAAENEKLNQIKSSLSTETKKYSDQIEKLHKQLEPWKNNIDAKQSQLNIENSEIELFQNQLESIKTSAEKIKNSIATKKDQIKINTSKINALNEKKSSLQANIDKNKNQFEFAGKELRKLEAELKEITDKVEYAKSRVSNAESQNKVLAGLTRLQQTGRISGFYGKLGDLGVIDDKYDIAVSTGGGALSDYVVDTVEDAQSCIQYLRQNNLGFGKFIVLEKLRKFNLNKINTPLNVPRLFDLIQPIDPKFAPAFYSSMYDTLVAPNLQTANKVAFGNSKRWRVVTLDGKLVDVSGTMSGGGSRVSKGAMKLRSNASSGDVVSPQQLHAWREELTQKDENYRNAETVYRKMDQMLRSSQEEIPRMSSEIVRLNMDNNTLADEIKEHERSLKDVSANKDDIKNLESQIELHSKKAAKLNKEKLKLEEDSKDLQNQIDDLQKKILDIGGLKLKTQTAKVQFLRDSIELKKEVKENDELKLTKLANHIQKLEKSIETSEAQLKEFEDILEKIKKKYEKKSKEVEKFQKQIDDLNNKRADLSNDIISIDDEIEEVDADLREKSELISDTLKQIGKIESFIRKDQIEFEHAEESLQNIEYRDVTPYISWMGEDDEEKNSLLQVPINFTDKYNEEELGSFDLKTMGDRVDSIKVELSDFNVNLDILLTYGEKQRKFKEESEDLDAASKALENLKENNDELNERRHEEFKAGFTVISETLKSMYNLITAGGTAELEYFDSHDAFAEGIVFSVMPPKKTWRTIANLSGGEKTLASLALVFALHHYKPTPLYVMDEIDAALDFKNVSIVANYIKSRTKNAQFIVISLRNNMFELAERLVGIYKVNNMTNSATIVNKDLIKRSDS